MGKKVITLTIDEGIYQTLRSRNENISGLVNNFLLTYSGISKEELEKSRAIKALMKKKAEIRVLEDNLERIEKQEKETEKEKGVVIKIGN